MAELKDLFVVYEGLAPKKKSEEQPKEDFSRWKNLIWLLNNKPVKQKKEEIEYNIISEVPGTNKKEPVYDSSQIIKPGDADYIEYHQEPLERIGDTNSYATASAMKTRALRNDFILHLDKRMAKRGIQDSYLRDMLIRIAGNESTYDSNADNGSAIGWFQFMDDTRAGLGNTMSRQEFINNKTAQIDLALDLFPQLINTLNQWRNKYGTKYIDNLTDDQLLYGMWWRPQSVLNVITTGSDDFIDSQGTTLSDVLKKGLR